MNGSGFRSSDSVFFGSTSCVSQGSRIEHEINSLPHDCKWNYDGSNLVHHSAVKVLMVGPYKDLWEQLVHTQLMPTVISGFSFVALPFVSWHFVASFLQPFASVPVFFMGETIKTCRKSEDYGLKCHWAWFSGHWQLMVAFPTAHPLPAKTGLPRNM